MQATIIWSMSTIKSGVSKTAVVLYAAQKSINPKQAEGKSSALVGAEQDTAVSRKENENACNSFMPYLHDDHYPDPRDLDNLYHQARWQMPLW